MQRAFVANAWRFRLTPICSRSRLRSASILPNYIQHVGYASAASSRRWTTRQTGDKYAKEARLQGLKSRAAFKLLEINHRYKFFKPGQTVVDLGYAPGSWSQVAVDRTHPNGRVIGIDIIPAQPPKGVSTIQGNFLSPSVQAEVRRYVQEPDRGRPRVRKSFTGEESDNEGMTSEDLAEASKGYVDFEKEALADAVPPHDGEIDAADPEEQPLSSNSDATVDVVLSDMSAPWPQPLRSPSKSLVNPYLRMMNTSGNTFRDHAGSMDLCDAALRFAFDTLKTGGTFVCKFYQGAEDKSLEKRLKLMFKKVHREKPESSRSESKESYFVALKRKPGLERSVIWHD